MKPFLVLTTYKPSRWRASIVGRELTDITQELGLKPHIDKSHGPLHLTGRNWVSYLLHAEVRRRTFNTTQAEGWHWDGDLDPNSKPDCAIVTWASNSPTEIKWRDNRASLLRAGERLDTVFQAKPYQIIIFRNLACLHRRPPNCPRVRWLFRQRCEIPKHMELP